MRIFPALILVFIACFAFGWFSLLADEFRQLGKHIAGGAVFVSNFVLWNESGYFDSAVDAKPLLHLWSLGVEEQFYIVWPVLVWFLYKKRFNLLSVGILLALVSFYLNIRQVKTDVVAAFYSPQTRFWELMLGSILAWITLYKPSFSATHPGKLDKWLAKVLFRDTRANDGKTLASTISVLALLLLMYGFWKIDKDIGFPGKWALVPVLGAVLLIFAGPYSWVNRTILSNRAVVWFGLISFPLYLWHWPLLSFARIVEGEVPERNIRIAAVALSIVLAWLTYRLVERPIRFGIKRKGKVTLLVLLMVSIGYVGYNAYSRDGLPFRFNRLSTESKHAVLKIADAWRFSSYPLPDGFFNDAKYGALRVGHNDGDKVLFVGDSHAKQYWNSVQPFIDRSGNKPSVMFLDSDFPANLSDDLINDKTIKVVVFSYFWAIKYGSDKVNQAVRCCANGKDGSVGLSGATNPHLGDKEMDAFDAKFQAISSKLREYNKRVYFVLDNPFGEENDPHEMLARSWNGFSLVKRADLTKELAIERSEPVRSRLIAIAKKSNAEIIDPLQSLCEADYCSAFSADGDLLYKDYDHLSLYTSKYRSSYLSPVFQN